jgi:hypothetical protein
VQKLLAWPLPRGSSGCTCRDGASCQWGQSATAFLRVRRRRRWRRRRRVT